MTYHGNPGVLQGIDFHNLIKPARMADVVIQLVAWFGT